MSEEKNIVVVRKWREKARTPADAIEKTKNTTHDEVGAWVEKEIPKGPGDYIPF